MIIRYHRGCVCGPTPEGTRIVLDCALADWATAVGMCVFDLDEVGRHYQWTAHCLAVLCKRAGSVPSTATVFP